MRYVNTVGMYIDGDVLIIGYAFSQHHYYYACLGNTLNNIMVDLSAVATTKLFCSQEKGKYELVAGQWKSSDDVITIYANLLRSYPGLLGYVDPLHHRVSLLHIGVVYRYYMRLPLLVETQLPFITVKCC